MLKKITYLQAQPNISYMKIERQSLEPKGQVPERPKILKAKAHPPDLIIYNK